MEHVTKVTDPEEIAEWLAFLNDPAHQYQGPPIPLCDGTEDPCETCGPLIALMKKQS